MSLYITATRRIVDGKVELAEQHTFEAGSFQEAAEIHQKATGSEEAVVFSLENGRRFRKASMVEVVSPPSNRGVLGTAAAAYQLQAQSTNGDQLKSVG